MTKVRLDELVTLADELDRLANASMEELYGADQLEAQRQLMAQFEKSQQPANPAPEEMK